MCIHFLRLLACLLILLPQLAAADAVRVGVLANRGAAQAIANWTATVDYLSQQLPAHDFVLVPLGFDEVAAVVERQGVEFVLVNTSMYVDLEVRFGVSRIATLRDRYKDNAYTRFGGVIVTRADREDIRSLEDLDERSFVAVEEMSLGGYQTALREFRKAGVDAPRAFSHIDFAGTMDAVLYAVRDGRADAGTVRTGVLERMAQEGKIRLADFRVINPRSHAGFDLLCSTELYPEWPFSKLSHVSDDLARDVASALLRMPEGSRAAREGRNAGWTIPGDYVPVHELMKELHLGPYRSLGQVHLADVLRKYWPWLLAAVALLFGMAWVTLHVTGLNRRLRVADAGLREARDTLELRVEQRTAELQQALRDLEESRRRMELAHRDWHDAFDAIKDPIFIHDAEGRIVHANPAYVARAGGDAGRILGNHYWQVFPRRDGPLELCKNFPEQTSEGNTEIVLDNGEVFVSRSFGIRHSDGSVRNAIHILDDVTATRHAQRELHRLNRALRTLSRGNETLVRAATEPELLRDVCRVLVDVGGYRLAWVGYADHDETLTVRPMSWAGYEEGYLSLIKVSWGNNEFGRGPIGTSIRTGKPSILHHVQKDIAFAPWREQAMARGYASIIALPLRTETEIIGALAIYSSEIDAFDAQEVELLTELANDLAFGIVTVRTRLRREQAETDLRASEGRYHTLYESAPTAYLSVSARDGRLLQFNEALVELLGYTRDELAQMRVFDFYRDDPVVRARSREIFERFRRGEGVRNTEVEMQRKGGEPIWVSVSVEPVRDAAGEVVESRSSIIDITSRKQMEAERERMTEQLQRALVQTIKAIALTIEKRDPYTAGHQQRVADLAVAIAMEMGLDQARVEGLRLGALIHDIGKIYVPAEFLNRPGKLSPAEYDIIHAHASMGYDIVRGIEFPWPVDKMVVQHHERIDGTGYPNGLRGDEILLEARILAVADVVEAMASHRPYRPALPLQQALSEIEQYSGVRYDPQAVEICLRLFREGRFLWDQGVIRAAYA